ncbi:MAG: type II toxin-antitoxin system HicB family antitoxin [Lentilactobacillus diolivorans]|nr:type II toxin-antitoxin system HicB family antitoxin [Lentilactobacillus diolivorans]RRG02404.1 MAG: type II toxin-antitoxin system HicB family antitoxin [Lactobacillus sp.]
MKYLYYALFTFDAAGKVEVTFPDLAPSAATFGDTVSDALHMAKDALEGYLLTAEDFGDTLPTSSDPQDIQHKQTQLLIPIEVNTTIAREREENRSVKKTLTIPKYLNDIGVKNKINFSSTLTEALKEKLGISK